MNILADPTKRGRGCYKHLTNPCFLKKSSNTCNFLWIYWYPRWSLWPKLLEQLSARNCLCTTFFHFCLVVALLLDSRVVPSLSAAWASFSIPSAVRATDWRYDAMCQTGETTCACIASFSASWGMSLMR